MLSATERKRYGYGSNPFRPKKTAETTFTRIHRLRISAAAIMNFQLPPNSAIASAARSASVKCAASSGCLMIFAANFGEVHGWFGKLHAHRFHLLDDDLRNSQIPEPLVV